MLGMPDMTPKSLAVAVASSTGKIIKNGLCVFEEEKKLQNGILHLVPSH